MSDVLEQWRSAKERWIISGEANEMIVGLENEIERLREELKHAHALADTLRKAIGVTGWTPNAALGEGKE